MPRAAGLRRLPSGYRASDGEPRISSRFSDRLIERKAREVFQQGGLIAGRSAGASFIGGAMLDVTSAYHPASVIAGMNETLCREFIIVRRIRAEVSDGRTRACIIAVR